MTKEILEIFTKRGDKLDALARSYNDVSERLMIAEEAIDKVGNDLVLVSDKEEEDIKKLSEFTNDKNKELLQRLESKVAQLAQIGIQNIEQAQKVQKPAGIDKGDSLRHSGGSKQPT